MPLGPSLGVNQMWTKRNDHAPKSECANVLRYAPKSQLKKKIKFDHSPMQTCTPRLCNLKVDEANVNTSNRWIQALEA